MSRPVPPVPPFRRGPVIIRRPGQHPPAQADNPAVQEPAARQPWEQRWTRKLAGLYLTARQWPFASNDAQESPAIGTAYSTDDELHTRASIYYVAFLLQQRLPAELVPEILHFADLLERQETAWLFPTQLYVSERDSATLVCESAVIDTRVRRVAPVERVEFRLRAHDQGYASDPSAGTWTWFTAAIVRACDVEDEFKPAEAAINNYAFLSQEDVRLKARIAQERELVRNPQARRESTDHFIVWRADSPVQQERDFVDSLRPGDRVIVRAWARFPMWSNHIEYAAVTICTPVVVR